MASADWYSWLRPHLLRETPAIFRLVLAALSGAILSLSYHGSFPQHLFLVLPGILLASILGSRARVAFFCGFAPRIDFRAHVRVMDCGDSFHSRRNVYRSGLGRALADRGRCGPLQSEDSPGRCSACPCVAIHWRWQERLFSGSPRKSFALICRRSVFPGACWVTRRRRIPLLLQLATITGVYGLSFLAAAFNALLLWTDCGPAEQRKGRVGIFSVVLAVLLLVMAIGPRFVPKAEAHHWARVVQPDFPENMQYVGDWYADHKSDLVDLDALSLRPSSTGVKPDLLIWPEAPAPFSFQDPHFAPYIAHLATDFHNPVIVGVIEWRPETDIVNGAPRRTMVSF